jgi:hypothetical protein
MKKKFGIYLIALMQMLSSCGQKAEPETYLIPSNYVGRVQIIFNQNGIPVKYKNEYNRDTIYTPQMGVPIKYEDVRRVYEIPSDGILLTQFTPNPGFTDTKYFSVDSNGKRTPLEIYKLDHSKRDTADYIVSDKSKKGIFGDGTTGSYGNMNIPFQDFTVCSYNQLDSFDKKEYLNYFNKKIEKAVGLSLF